MPIEITLDSGSIDILAGRYMGVYTAPINCIFAVVNARMISRNLANNIAVRAAIVPAIANWIDGIIPPLENFILQPLDLILGPNGIAVGMIEDTGIILKPGDTIVMYCDSGNITGRVHGLVRTLPGVIPPTIPPGTNTGTNNGILEYGIVILNGIYPIFTTAIPLNSSSVLINGSYWDEAINNGLTIITKITNKVISWVKTLGYSGYDFGYVPHTSTDGTNIYVLAEGLSDNVLIKIDPNGGLEIPTYSENFLIKMDIDGNIIWSRNFYIDPVLSVPGAIYTDTLSNNVYCISIDGDISVDAELSSLSIFNSDGIHLWTRTMYYSGVDAYNNCMLTGVSVDSIGNIYTAGRYVFDRTNSYYDSCIVKFDFTGTLQWQRKLSITVYDTATGVVITSMIGDSSGNSYVTGSMFSPVSYSQRESWFLIKIDSLGNTLWQVSLSDYSSWGAMGDRSGPYGASLDAVGNIYVAVNVGTANPVKPQQYIWIAKYNSNGILQWQRTLTMVDWNLNAISISVNDAGLHLTGDPTNYTTYIEGKEFYINLPTDGSHTGEWTLDGFTYTYSPSTLIPAIPNIQNSQGELVVEVTTPTINVVTIAETNSALTATSMVI